MRLCTTRGSSAEKEISEHLEMEKRQLTNGLTERARCKKLAFPIGKNDNKSSTDFLSLSTRAATYDDTKLCMLQSRMDYR